MSEIILEPLQDNDREQFILDNQRAFKYGALEEFGRRDDHFEEGEEIISRKTIENSIDAPNSETYRIIADGQKAGGIVINIDRQSGIGHLDLLFTLPEVHSKGIGYAAWTIIEGIHPEIRVWETVTPYFETRNIHFYVNRCGFHIVEFFNKFHPDPNDHYEEIEEDNGMDGMFRFQKVMTR